MGANDGVKSYELRVMNVAPRLLSNNLWSNGASSIVGSRDIQQWGNQHWGLPHCRACPIATGTKTTIWNTPSKTMGDAFKHISRNGKISQKDYRK
jgi:hypothetical protein